MSGEWGGEEDGRKATLIVEHCRKKWWRGMPECGNRVGGHMRARRRVNVLAGQGGDEESRIPAVCGEGGIKILMPRGGEESQMFVTPADEESRVDASCGGPALLGLAIQGATEGLARIGEARRGGGDRLSIGRGRRIGFKEGLKQIGRGNARFVKGVAVIQHPASQQGFGRLLDPLIDQGADFAAQICRMVQARQLETLQRCGRCLSQILKRRNDSAYGHY